MLKIDDNYRVEYDGANNYTLIYEGQKIATKGKNEGQLITEKEEYYYPSVYHCLKRYLMLKQGESETVEEYIKITERVFEQLKELAKTYENNNNKRTAKTYSRYSL